VGSHGPQNGWHANVGEALRHDGGVVGEVAGQGVGVDRGATLRERRQCVVRSS
jgi:hypothetical protein